MVNGHITFTSTTVGSLASYTCQRESQQGDTVLECLENGVWSGAPPFCPSEYESERLDKKIVCSYNIHGEQILELELTLVEC